GAKPLTSRMFGSTDIKDGVPCRWQNALLPVLVLVVTTLIGLFVTGGGWEALRQDARALFSLALWRDAFANGSSGLVLCWASALGSLVAIALALGQRLLSPHEALRSWGKGAVSMWMAALLLTLAWTLNGLC